MRRTPPPKFSGGTPQGEVRVGSEIVLGRKYESTSTQVEQWLVSILTVCAVVKHRLNCAEVLRKDTGQHSAIFHSFYSVILLEHSWLTI